MTDRLVLAIMLALAASPSAARDSLGVYDGWGAFRDAAPLRCYAIAKASGENGERGAYATIANWPARGVRGTVHLVLSREVTGTGPVRMAVGGKRFELVAKGRNAWARNAQGDAAIIAAIRSASRMSVSSGGFTDRYTLAGAATAIDAATVACAKSR